MTIIDTSRAGTISAPELMHTPTTDWRLIDVRSPGEFSSVRIEGSYNIPLDQLSNALPTLTSIDAPLILICASGARAERAQEQLLAAGCVNSAVLEGGLAAWQTAGGDVEINNPGKWAMERQVRGVAGSIVLASVLASVAFPKARFIAGGIGAGLTYSALSNTCTMAKVLGKLPYNQSPDADVEQTLRQLRQP